MGPAQWVGTKGLWPQLKGERLKVQHSPRKTDQFSGSQQLLYKVMSSQKHPGMGMQKRGMGRGLEAHGNTDQTQAFLPPRAAPLGTLLQLGAEAVMPHGKSHPQNVSAQIRQAEGGVRGRKQRPRQRAECSVHLQTMARVELVRNKIPCKS